MNMADFTQHARPDATISLHFNYVLFDVFVVVMFRFRIGCGAKCRRRSTDETTDSEPSAREVSFYGHQSRNMRTVDQKYFLTNILISDVYYQLWWPRHLFRPISRRRFAPITKLDHTPPTACLP